jgi:CHAD domain-containing protein
MTGFPLEFGALEFVRPPALGLDAVAEALAQAPVKPWRLRREPPTLSRRVFLDTFEWRLFRKGFSLEEVTTRDGAELVCRELKGGILHRLGVAAPRFVWDLPEGPLRAFLEDLVEMRALGPLTWVRTRSRPFALLNGEEKIVCRLWAEEHWTADVEKPPRRLLEARLRLEPLRGYEDALSRVAWTLGGELALEPAPRDVFERVLEARGLKPSAYSGKVRVALAPELPAAEAARLILRQLYATMEENLEGVRADVDSEFLHDFRVAVRRTRSALGQLKGVLPPSATGRFVPEFAWLGTATSPLRDLDVHLLDFPRYRAALPPEHRGDLDPLKKFLDARRKRELKALLRALDSSRYRKFSEDWRALLASPFAPSPDAPAGALPVGEVAGRRIRKVMKKALRQGNALDAHSAPESFHELRKTLKKLRYLIEFFQSLYPAEEIRHFVASLKDLQDNMGEFQDLEVQAGALRQFSVEMAEAPRGLAGVGPATYLAMGMLIEKLLARQEEVRREFAQKFAAFSDADHRKRFEHLFGAARPTEAANP